jgi:hypothetical protein
LPAEGELDASARRARSVSRARSEFEGLSGEVSPLGDRAAVPLRGSRSRTTRRGSIPVVAVGRDALAALVWDAGEVDVNEATISATARVSAGTVAHVVLSVAPEEPLVFPQRDDVEACRQNLPSKPISTTFLQSEAAPQRNDRRLECAIQPTQAAANSAFLEQQRVRVAMKPRSLGLKGRRASRAT